MMSATIADRLGQQRGRVGAAICVGPKDWFTTGCGSRLGFYKYGPVRDTSTGHRLTAQVGVPGVTLAAKGKPRERVAGRGAGVTSYRQEEGVARTCRATIRSLL